MLGLVGNQESKNQIMLYLHRYGPSSFGFPGCMIKVEFPKALRFGFIYFSKSSFEIFVDANWILLSAWFTAPHICIAFLNLLNHSSWLELLQTAKGVDIGVRGASVLSPLTCLC